MKRDKYLLRAETAEIPGVRTDAAAQFHPEGFPRTGKYLILLGAILLALACGAAFLGATAARQQQYFDAHYVRLAMQYCTLRADFDGRVALSELAELSDKEILHLDGGKGELPALRETWGLLHMGYTDAAGNIVLPNPVCLCDGEGAVAAFCYLNAEGRWISYESGAGWSRGRHMPDFCASLTAGEAPPEGTELVTLTCRDCTRYLAALTEKGSADR